MPIMLAHTLLTHRLAEVRKSGQARLAAARRQVPGDRGVRQGQSPGARGRRGGLHPAHRGGGQQEVCGRRSSSTSSGRPPGEHAGRRHQVPHQSHRPFRDRRAHGRHRPDRPQDHRGHLRRHGPPRRRRFLRQGPDQGGPLRLLHGALHRQEHRGRGPGRAAARCSWPMPSAWPSRSASWWTPSAPARSTEGKLVELVRKNFQLTPKGIIESLQLRRPIYSKTAAYGHFGRKDPDFTWEATDKAAALASRPGRRPGNRLSPSDIQPAGAVDFFRPCRFPFRVFLGFRDQNPGAALAPPPPAIKSERSARARIKEIMPTVSQAKCDVKISPWPTRASSASSGPTSRCRCCSSSASGSPRSSR